MKKCPFCAEEIQDEAIKCKHCSEFLNELPRTSLFASTPKISLIDRALSKARSVAGALRTHFNRFRQKWLGVCFVVVCLAFVVSFVAFAYYRHVAVVTEEARGQGADFMREKAALLSRLAELESSVARTERFAAKSGTEDGKEGESADSSSVASKANVEAINHDTTEVETILKSAASLEEKDLAAAIAVLKNAATLHPDDYAIHWYLAELYMSDKNVNRKMDVTPAQAAIDTCERTRKNSLTSTIESLKTLARIKPHLSVTGLMLGRLLAESGNIAEAEQQAELVSNEGSTGAEVLANMIYSDIIFHKRLAREESPPIRATCDQIRRKTDNWTGIASNYDQWRSEQEYNIIRLKSSHCVAPPGLFLNFPTENAKRRLELMLRQKFYFTKDEYFTAKHNGYTAEIKTIKTTTRPLPIPKRPRPSD